MRLLLIALACILASGPGIARSATPGPIGYTVTPVMSQGELRALAVDIVLDGDPDGATHLRLPDKWSGVTGLHRAISEVRAEGGRLERLSPVEFRIRHAPGERISFRYLVRQDFRGELTAGEGPPFRAVIRKDRFTALGWALFAEVAGPAGRPVNFRWGAAPDGWTLASDLDHEPQLANTGELLDSVLTGGRDLQIIERPVAGGRVRVAVHGDWKFRPDALTGLLVRVADASSTFWGDEGESFFVTVTPMKAPPGGGSAQYGVGLGDAFSLWATPDATEASLQHIVAHEHQHVWFPTRVGGVRTGQDEPLDYWLSEGFTDFYTLRLLLRSGVWTLEDYVSGYNRILRDYASSPVIGAPNEVILAGFWEDPAVADLPYLRGMVLAALWDHRLRTSTGGRHDMDDVVLAMRDLARDQDGRGRAVENLTRAYASFGGDLREDLLQRVEGGKPVRLPDDLFGSCARVVTVETPVFDRGFDTVRTNLQGGVVAAVDPEGPAYAAGLRNGMRIVGRLSPASVQDARVELMYRVVDEAGERMIRYRPAGRRTMTLQEIVLTPGMNADQRAACSAVMSGR